MSPAPPSPEVLHTLMRSLPSMNAVLGALEIPSSMEGLDAETAERCKKIVSRTPRPLLREAVEAFLDERRAAVRNGVITDTGELALKFLLPGIIKHAAAACPPSLRRVVNATGVIVHTNLGRSILAEEAAAAVADAACGYSNLEFDLETGERGSRHSHVEKLICRLTGAEAAIAVNNNAAAVLLMLDTLCKGREVVVSRGELVEIGGSFRIPAVMEKSGCILREVGATNRTYPADYAAAVTENTAALMKVHTSNYRIIGFACDVSRTELAALARKKNIPLLEDIGSGILLDMAALGAPDLGGEPAVRQVLAEGADVVTFSGDKVLGGPQAGIIAGRAEYIERIRQNQLHRAVRIDKLTLAALEATLRLYADPGAAGERVPTLRMICMRGTELRRRAEELFALLARAAEEFEEVSVTIGKGGSRVGGGAFPEVALPTSLVRVASPVRPDVLQQALLGADPPVLARVERDCLCFDPRTMRREEYADAAAALRRALTVCSGGTREKEYE